MAEQGNGAEPVTEDVNRKITNMIHKSDNVASDDVMAELSPDIARSSYTVKYKGEELPLVKYYADSNKK